MCQPPKASVWSTSRMRDSTKPSDLLILFVMPQLGPWWSAQVSVHVGAVLPRGECHCVGSLTVAFCARFAYRLQIHRGLGG